MFSVHAYRTLISNVFVMQVCWEVVPNIRPGAPTKCIVCAWNSARSVGGQAEPTSKTFGNQVYVVSQ